ncbi:MAG: energy-coupling factor transporter transmembrane protein EcfT [Clostridia bacterium]|nr:energy-coupling factor transporter transmembrane protein EcfT [Clostridia bacterium]
MKAFDRFNPITVFVYFAFAAGIAMFSMDPVLLGLSMLGAVLLFCLRTEQRQTRTHLFSLFLFVTLTVINPLFQHNGVTVLFVLNDNPVTLEALLYGANAAGMIVGVLYWFRSFSDIITSDKLLYLFGSISSKLALMVSMALRYVPLFRRQARKTDAAQRALGQYRNDNVIDSIRVKLSVFSIVVSWALENGIVTADSMAARGYGLKKRSFFSLYRFGRKDFALLLCVLVAGGLTALLMGRGALDFAFYPRLTALTLSPERIAAYIAYGLLALLPSAIEIGDSIKWQYLRSGT